MTVILPLSAIINRPGLFKRRSRLAFFLYCIIIRLLILFFFIRLMVKIYKPNISKLIVKCRRHNDFELYSAKALPRVLYFHSSVSGRVLHALYA